MTVSAQDSIPDVERRLEPLFSWRSALSQPDSGLTATERHVCLALSLYMNERGGSAFPGARRLAGDTGLHVSTVREALGHIRDKGWLEVVEHGGTSDVGRRANAYVASVPLAQGDPTPRPPRAHPSSSPTPPLAQGDPITSLNTSLNTARARQKSQDAADLIGELDSARAESAPPPWRAFGRRPMDFVRSDSTLPEDDR